MGSYLDTTALYLFNTGDNAYAYRALGAHEVTHDSRPAIRFAVWAPNAAALSVVGTFNDWDAGDCIMHRRGATGVWEAHSTRAHRGDLYKFAITTREGEVIYKADPFAFYSQLRPGTASVIYPLENYCWNDTAHMRYRAGQRATDAPMNIYEVHPGSWRKGLDWDALGDELIPYAVDMGYTHIELMPVCEYPLDDSWGYQVTGYFSITSRYGTPVQLKRFVDRAHQAGLGVFADWVPAHFTRDAHGLRRFDGTPTFEPADEKRSDQPQWGTVMFDYGKREVHSFLISSAVFLLDEFHLDGLRVDAVSCMLYLDYGKSPGEWLPNIDGGRENLEAIDFLKHLTSSVKRECPGALMIAEESTAFPNVTGDASDGLGFDFKWNMGWMNDTLDYFSLDPLYRPYHHDKLTFSMCYAFDEHHVLPFSHDEVVHGKLSLIGRMWGDYTDKFRSLRQLLMFQISFPGKKLNFMGNELAQFIEWDFKRPLDWFLLDYPSHSEFRTFVRELNAFYKRTPALYEGEDSWSCFRWISVDDSQRMVIAFLRMDADGNELLCAFNLSPVRYESYPLALPRASRLTQVMSNVDMRAISGIETREDGADNIAQLFLSPYEAVYYSVERTNNDMEGVPA